MSSYLNPATENFPHVLKITHNSHFISLINTGAGVANKHQITVRLNERSRKSISHNLMQSYVFYTKTVVRKFLVADFTFELLAANVIPPVGC